MDKKDAFKALVGPIGENYQADDWLTNLGVFCLGWEAAEREANKTIERIRDLQFRPIGDNHHNAALCPHCGEPLRKAIEALRDVVSNEGDPESVERARSVLGQVGGA